MTKSGQALVEQRILRILVQSYPLHKQFLVLARQRNILRDRRIPDNAFRILAAPYGLDFAEEAIAYHRNADVAAAEDFLGAIGNSALTDPGDEVLVHDMRRYPASVGSSHGRPPGRHALLNIGLAPLWD